MGFSSLVEVEGLCMRNLLANPEERVFFKDLESRFLLVSEGWLAAYAGGRSLEQVIGKTDFDIFSRPHALAAFEDEQRVIETGEAMVTKVERETFHDRPDAWVSTIKLPLRDDQGSIIGTWGITHDVSERERAEAERARLATVVECSQDAINGADRDGVITVWNPGAERLYGYTAAEAIGQPLSLLVPPARRGEERAILSRVLAGEPLEHYQTERARKDGSVVTLSLSASPIRDTKGRVIGASAIARDVTPLLRAQEQIALQAELLDEVDAAVILTDTSVAVRYWSRGAQQLYGYTAEEAVGRPLFDLIIPEEHQAEVMKLGRGAIAGIATEGEHHARDKQGRVFPVYVRLRNVPLTGGDRGSRGVVGVSVDITGRRAVEQASRRHTEGQEEIANLGRLALKGGPLEELFDRAVHAASRVLSADCAWLAERLSDASEFVIRAGVGWPEACKGELIGSAAGSLVGYAVSSRGSVVVADWVRERRFARSDKLADRGMGSSITALIGDPDSPVGVLAVDCARPQVVPADCVSFLDALANVLGEAIQARYAQEMIRHHALYDGLTGLPNRTLFLDRVAHALAQTDRRRRRLAVFFIDLDHFKLVNDSLGHNAGDQLLKLLATRLGGAIRHGDTLARLGGDEFAVLCENLPSEVAATRIANQLMTALEEPFALDGDQRPVNASIGIALSTGESSAADLLRDADAALYHTKRAGRGRFALFDVEMRARVVGRVRTESALRAALANQDQIFVHYQPLVCLHSGRIVGAEALARWRHPDRGLVSPIEFIPVAEDSGLIHQLGAQIVSRAACESAAWQDNRDFAGINVNVSTRQLVQTDEVPALVRHAIAAEGIKANFLTLEITESTLIEQLSSAQEALGSLKDLGVRLSLDDFGTGYSSLSYLNDLPFDSVKIDRSLTKNITDTPHAAGLAAAIVQMGHALELQVIAEGIETREQATCLQALGCDIGQGFYFAKPMAPELLTALLHKRPYRLPRSAKSSRTNAATTPAR
ncbi:MAG: EAL domain-containing protein [Solirubrobacteraceae bacterium]